MKNNTLYYQDNWGQQYTVELGEAVPTIGQNVYIEAVITKISNGDRHDTDLSAYTLIEDLEEYINNYF